MSKRDADTFYTIISYIEYDYREQRCFVQNQVIDTELVTTEYSTPLDFLEISDLYEIAERL